MEINVNGVKITLTKNQLEEIDKQVKKNKPLFERIQSIQDVYNELGIDDSFIPYKNPKTLEEKATNAHAILLRIAKVYQEGTELDWKNFKELKYIPYKCFGGGSVSVGMGDFSYCFLVSGGLYYKSAKLAEDALSKFRNIYDDYWMI